jgi:Ca2+-binding RTX toxin-like protein
MFFRKNGKRAFGQKRTQVVLLRPVFETLHPRRLNSVTVTETFPGYYEIIGTQYADQIEVGISNRELYVNGDFAADEVYHALVLGGAGNDSITAITTGDSTIVIDGGSDNDVVSSEGSSAIWGGHGDDTLYIKDSPQAEVYGEGGCDYIIISGACYDGVVDGGADNDTIDASESSTPLVLKGGAGNDTFYDTGFNDWIYGGTGFNILYHVGGDFDDIHDVEIC